MRTSATARGQLREFKKAAEVHRDAIDRLLPTLSSTGLALVDRPSVKGRTRVFDRLARMVEPHARLHDVHLTGRAPLAVWTYLRPRNAIMINPDSPHAAQDCVTTEYLMVGLFSAPNRKGAACGLWTLEISDHALLRLLDRDPGTDLAATLFDAHRTALALPATIYKGPGPQELLLSAGAGAFLCEIHSDMGASLFLRAATWLHADQLGSDQVVVAPGEPGSRLGDGLLLPHPLRVAGEPVPRQVVARASAHGPRRGVPRPLIRPPTRPAELGALYHR